MVEKDNEDFIFDFPRTEENAALFRSHINWEEEERKLEEEEKQNKGRESKDWATETLKEAPFWRDGMTPEEYDEEREYLGKNYTLLQKRTYVPLWKQRRVE